MIQSRTGGRREYEKQFLAAARLERVIVMFWTRRGRKSTNLGAVAFDDMSKKPGETVIAASASLLLGTELISMTVSAVEAAMIVQREAAAQQVLFQSQSDAQKLDFRCVDTAKPDHEFTQLSPEDFADLYQSKRLEMRLYFDRTNYSRQLVIAPVPATARGWRGTVLRDEAGFTPVNLELALREAVDPIFRDVPDLRMIYASNLCRDSRHPFFSMTLPPPDMNFTPDKRGHFYRGENRVLIHRVSLADAYEAGHTLYDNKGQPMTLAEFRSEPANKGQLPYNYDLIHQSEGTAAIDLFALLSAQQRGANQCQFVFVDDEAEFQRALGILREILGAGPVGIGVDPATTTKDTSNPTSVTITERRGIERVQRMVFCWKEKKAKVATYRLRRIVETIQQRRDGGPARRMCLAATNERYWADLVADELRSLLPVQLVIESEGLHPAGYDDPINYKTFLGDVYSAAVNDNHYAMPQGEYFKRDQLLTVKNKGRYECAPDSATGAHGDTFVSGGLAEMAVMGPSLPTVSSTAITPHGRRGEELAAGNRRNMGRLL